MRSFAISVLVAASLALVACGAKDEIDPKDLLSKPMGEPPVVTGGVAVGPFTEPVQIEEGVGIHAIAAGDGAITVSLRNHGAGPIDVRPAHFAVITGPRRDKDLILVNVATADLSGFTPERLEPGANGTYRIKLHKVPNPRGMVIVFREPVRRVKAHVKID